METLEMLQDTDDLNNFNIIEYAEGGALHNCIFKNVNDKVNTDGKTDCYHTAFIHTKKIIEYANIHKNEKGKPTVKGYKDEVWAKELIIDFDIEEENQQEDLDNLLEDLRKLLRTIESKYELDLKHIRINFSGRKGFHIRIPAILFGGFTPSENLPSQLKSIALELVEGMRIDTSIYSHIFYIRYVNSKNSKSGLCAIPLTAQEVFNLSIDQIKELAKNPREIVQIEDEELEPNVALTELKEKSSSSKPNKKIKSTEQTEDLWGNVPVGQRNKTLTKNVGRLIERKVMPNDILALVLLWNRSLNDPEDEGVVKSHVQRLINDYGVNLHTFWKRNEKKEIVFSLVEFRKYLEAEGFAKTYLGKGYVFIKISNNIIKEVTLTQIKDHVLNYIRNIDNPHKVEVEEAILRSTTVLEKDLIESITTLSPQINMDNKNKAVFYFNNSVVEVSKDEIRTGDYKTTNGLVWESQVIKRDITIDDKTESDFEKFLFNVAGSNEEKFRSFQSAIGYLLHSYKDSSNAKVVVLCDEKVTEFPDGRTGKSLFGKAISNVKRSVRIDGKNFTFDNRFTFQQVNLDTQVLEFNDVKKDFDFENLFSVITDDMSIENKGQKPFVIPFSKSPKILASTNYTIRGLGSSFRDRLFEIEFSDFYNEAHRPIDDFGKRFLDDWDESEWNAFYNFMFKCVKIYLDKGLIYPINVNLQMRKLIDSTSREFVEFMETQDLSDGRIKKILYENFQHNYPDYLWLKQNTFSKWLKSYCEIRGLKLYENRSNGNTIVLIK